MSPRAGAGRRSALPSPPLPAGVPVPCPRGRCALSPAPSGGRGGAALAAPRPRPARGARLSLPGVAGWSSSSSSSDSSSGGAGSARTLQPEGGRGAMAGRWAALPPAGPWARSGPDAPPAARADAGPSRRRWRAQLPGPAAPRVAFAFAFALAPGGPGRGEEPRRIRDSASPPPPLEEAPRPPSCPPRSRPRPPSAAGCAGRGPSPAGAWGPPPAPVSSPLGTPEVRLVLCLVAAGAGAVGKERFSGRAAAGRSQPVSAAPALPAPRRPPTSGNKCPGSARQAGEWPWAPRRPPGRVTAAVSPRCGCRLSCPLCHLLAPAASLAPAFCLNPVANFFPQENVRQLKGAWEAGAG